MGYQATIIIHLDEIDTIAQDKDFGKKLAAAVLEKANKSPQGDQTVRFNTSSARKSAFAGAVIEVHHADHNVIVESGGNTGRIIRPQCKNFGKCGK
ncbi:MAG: hypothetical protein EP349_01840 [Alphaproteobacteria bacterium]|nr:MAG: hypothetical protein EP349_01840 [Alphaproteobacteria bacterium]